MSADPRVVVLCGGKLAFPAIQILALHRFLVGIAVGSAEIEVVRFLGAESKKSGLAFKSFARTQELHGLLDWLHEVSAQVVFCIGFPFKLSAEVVNTRGIQFINFHTGSLPEYRGPMPIFEVLRNGETETALTLHFMDENYDTGAVIFNEPIKIVACETFGSLAFKMSERAGQAALNMAQMIAFGTIVPSHPQSEEVAQYFPKVRKQDLMIRWELMQAEEIMALVNACNPWNGGAETFSQTQMVKIISVKLGEIAHEMQPGAIMELDETKGVLVACIEDKYLSLEIVSTDLGITAGYRLKELGIVKGDRFLS